MHSEINIDQNLKIKLTGFSARQYETETQSLHLINYIFKTKMQLN